MDQPEMRTVGIVGAGVMGAGIAEVMAGAGLDVLLFDGAPERAAQAKAQIAERQHARAAAGKTAPEAVEAMLGRLRPVGALSDLGPADLVVEAIVEQIDAKRELVQALEHCLRADAIIATNTSSLSVTAIAARAQRPERIAGFHFFNPVPAMKVVEVIAGARTATEATEALVALARRIGHQPVTARDTPGFIVNHAGRAYGTEALAMLKEGVAPVEAIDTIMREAAGFRMGPFELMDLTGLDVTHQVMEGVYAQFYQDPRYRPSVITARRLEAGLLGRKTGEGFYRYADGKRLDAVADPRPAGRLPGSVVVLDDSDDLDVTQACKAAGVRIAATAGDAEMLLVGLTGHDLTQSIARLGLDAAKTVGFDAVFGLTAHVTLVASPATDPEIARSALAVVAGAGLKATLVADSCGAVCQRVVAMIVNIASEIVEQGIATAADVDTAVRLGLGYPYGPLAWGDRIGPHRILTILDRIHDRTRDPRYRASLWLRRHAELGLPLAQVAG